jgi:hypothetical protein
VQVTDGHATHVTSDSDNPTTQGLTCTMARTLPQLLAEHNRVLRPCKRTSTARPVTTEGGFDYTGQPLMSNIPVRILKQDQLAE